MPIISPADLIAELERYTAFDATEEASRQKTLAWLRAHPITPDSAENRPASAATVSSELGISTDILRSSSTVSLESETVSAQKRVMGWALGSTHHNPADRTVYTPGHATGSAIIIADDTKEILFVLHGKLKRWIQPGGHAEIGDASLPATALREAQEETGIALQPTTELFDIDAHRVPTFRDTPSHIHFDFRYLFRTTQAPPRASAESGDVRWFSRATLPDLSGDGGVERVIAKCIARGCI